MAPASLDTYVQRPCTLHPVHSVLFAVLQLGVPDLGQIEIHGHVDLDLLGQRALQWFHEASYRPAHRAFFRLGTVLQERRLSRRAERPATMRKRGSNRLEGTAEHA